MEYQPDENAFVFEMTPSAPEEKANQYEELILTPSPVEERQASPELIMEVGGIFRAGEITFDGEEESEARIREAMEAYDKAMDDAADIRR